MLDFRQDLFEIFQQNDGDYLKYERTVDYCTKVKNVVRGNDKAEFYNVLTKLEFLINNAGWEEKKDEILRILWDEKNAISDKYEEFLP